MPETVQVRKVHPRPRVAKHPIVDPAHDGHQQYSGIANAQPVDPFIFNAAEINKVKRDSFCIFANVPILTFLVLCTKDKWQGWPTTSERTH